MEGLNKKTKIEAYRKTICFVLLFAFCFNAFGRVVLAQTDPVTEDVTISARVGGPATGITGSLGLPNTAVRFSGEAYPGATVTILKGGFPLASVIADKLGTFSATIEEKYNSTVVYTLFALDVAGNKSLLINYPIVIYEGYLTHLSGIRFAPTIVTNRAEVKFGDYLTLTGYSLPSAALQVSVEGVGTKSFTLTSSKDGSYKIILPMLDLPRGDYVVYIKYVNDSRISKLVKFIIGDANIPNQDITENIPGDCNYDGIINLVDFSVLAFWYGKANPPKCVDTNRDNRIDLIDFSILAFWWTG